MPSGTATHSFREAARERAGTSLAARLKRAADLARAEKGGAAAPPGPTMSTNWTSVLEAAVAQRRAKIANNGPRGAMALEVRAPPRAASAVAPSDRVRTFSPPAHTHTPAPVSGAPGRQRAFARRCGLSVEARGRRRPPRRLRRRRQ